MPRAYRYWAFISYSHRDAAAAEWVHDALERYRTPRRLVGRETAVGAIPKKLYPIFRDRDELAGAAELGERLLVALEEARSLIVICSPRSARSKWVNEEVRAFKAMGREDRVLSLIIDGEPNVDGDAEIGHLECFPLAVRRRIGPDGRLTEEPIEPLAADVREGKDGKANAKLKLVAGILGVGYDELRQREKQRQRWARARSGSAVLAALGVISLAYVAVADQGARLPLGDGIRASIDRVELSRFRPVRSDEEVREAATALRAQYLRRVLREAAENKWGADAARVGVHPQWWSVGQAIASALRVPDATNDQLRPLLAWLRRAFEPGAFVEAKGRAVGWLDGHMSFTLGLPVIWMASAIATALARPGLVPDVERPWFERAFETSTQITTMYRPTDSGGWNTAPHQVDVHAASTYATVLALFALLDARRAGLPWEGSIETRDRLLGQTVDWLVRHYDPRLSPPGWRAAVDDRDLIADGLTLQIYGGLLRAEEEAGLPVPDDLVRRMSEHVASLSTRTFEFPSSSTRVGLVFIDHDDKQRSEVDFATFLWVPWGIEAATRVRRRLERTGTRRDEIVRVRRAIGHLVVDFASDMRRVVDDEKTLTYVVSETLFALSSVP